MAKSICFYFQVHQPFRIKPLPLVGREPISEFFDHEHEYESNEAIFNKVSTKCYLPTTESLLKMCQQHPQFRCSFSLSGVFLEQCEIYPELGKKVLKNLKDLMKTGQVELLAETYHHSLTFLYSKLEYAHQIQLHRDLIWKHFKVKPRVFRNTELIYSNEIAEFIRQLGYDAMIAEGWDTAMEHDNPNLVHASSPQVLPHDDQLIAHKYRLDKKKDKTKASNALPVLTKNYQLSDDIAFRFGNKEWPSYPLHTETFAEWVDQAPGDTVNLFMDFETFGEHQWADTGIFDFLEHLPGQCLARDITFRTPSETIGDFEPKTTYDTDHFVSWADENRDISAWVENDMQRSALAELQDVEGRLHGYRKHKHDVVEKLWDDFRKLSTSDHLYYMSTKYYADGDVHSYFSPYPHPYDAYINFMNALEHLNEQVTDWVDHKGKPPRGKSKHRSFRMTPTSVVTAK